MMLSLAFSCSLAAFSVLHPAHFPERNRQSLIMCVYNLYIYIYKCADLSSWSLISPFLERWERTAYSRCRRQDCPQGLHTLKCWVGAFCLPASQMVSAKWERNVRRPDAIDTILQETDKYRISKVRWSSVSFLVLLSSGTMIEVR